MNSRFEKKPARPRPVHNNQAVDADKLSKSGNQKDVTVDWEIVDSTKEEVDVQLNDVVKVKTFEEVEKENDHLRTMLDSSERKCMEAGAAMKLMEDELNSTIIKLENKIFSLQESLANEESQKLDAIVSHNQDKKANMSLKKDHEILKEKLVACMENLSTANGKVKQQEDMYKKLQEYNTSLQQYNSKLQTELKAATDAHKQVEKEKSAILENHSNLRGHYTLLQNEFNSTKKSRDEAVERKESALKEVEALRVEFEQIREDRELQVSQLLNLDAEFTRYKESTGRTAETCSAQRELISVLQVQLHDTKKKLKELKGKNIWFQ